MGGIIERLQSLLGRGDESVTDITSDAGAVDAERAIEAVDAAREASQVDALFALTDTPGSVDD